MSHRLEHEKWQCNRAIPAIGKSVLIVGGAGNANTKIGSLALGVHISWTSDDRRQPTCSFQ